MTRSATQCTAHTPSPTTPPDIYPRVGGETRRAAQRAVQQAKDRHERRRKATQKLRYLLEPAEIFSRAYSQYIAWRSGDDALLSDIDRWMRMQAPGDQLRQWPYEDFLPLIWRFDNLLEAQGWLTRTRIT